MAIAINLCDTHVFEEFSRLSMAKEINARKLSERLRLFLLIAVEYHAS